MIIWAKGGNMRVKCVANKLTRKGFLETLIKPGGQKSALDDDFYVIIDNQVVIDNETDGYDLAVDKVYDCYGVMYFKNEVRFLIVNESYFTPKWFPSDLFDIVDSSLPYNWHCNSFNSDSINGWMLGYKELVEDYTYLLDLIQEIPYAITIFNNMKENLEYVYIIEK